MKKVIVAGANSFVASHFVHELLAQNYHVIALVRGNNGSSANDRMMHALKDTTLEMPLESGILTVMDYAMLEEDFGLAKNDLKSIFNGVSDYFHFAASLKFDYRSREEIYETNVNGVENALHIFNNYSRVQGRFFFISTAYSCGHFSGVFKEKFYPDQDVSAFRNYYELSKRLAENVIRRFMKSNPVNAHIVRLSQVVGNSRTGVTRTDYGVFDFAKRVFTLAQEYPGQTIRIHADPDANQNFISINTVVSDLVNLVRSKEVPIIMNFVANRPLENSIIIRCISELLPIELIPVKNIQEKDMNELEKMVLAGMSFTGNYIDTDIPFDTTERDKILSDGHHAVNESSLFAMLSYYLDRVAEGKTIESPT